jgi:hypothetical protein
MMIKMKHIKSIDNFLNEQLFSDANRFAKLFGTGGENSPVGSTGAATAVSTSRNDESSCPNNDCWTHFGKESFWNGSSQIGGRAVPKITIKKSPTSFDINYDGPASGFLLKHAKGGKGDTIHQLLNVLTLELNEYLKTLSVKPDVKNIKMEMMGSKLSVSVPLVKVPEGTHYLIARRGGLGHGGDFTGLLKYRNMDGYEEAKHKSGSLTEKFVTVILK